jgi:hypothetical protein
MIMFNTNVLALECWRYRLLASALFLPVRVSSQFEADGALTSTTGAPLLSREDVVSWTILSSSHEGDTCGSSCGSVAPASTTLPVEKAATPGATTSVWEFPVKLAFKTALTWLTLTATFELDFSVTAISFGCCQPQTLQSVHCDGEGSGSGGGMVVIVMVVKTMMVVVAAAVVTVVAIVMMVVMMVILLVVMMVVTVLVVLAVVMMVVAAVMSVVVVMTALVVMMAVVVVMVVAVLAVVRDGVSDTFDDGGW